ncbi:toll/interleukin-1 receptor domain-containing protein [Siminovitchia terrae]|uniref:Toll/interleukin-1 receptor domain-containing protein n=1 Tax=Siminovitchia terrae TaxID=1914933 RepID=A0A429XA32_SIMTE|nr:toll/interleukin-1 receptor domain-containing protein [Siminovitchia terrae]RST60219.1 toll/interleukin-1 receptor domain-containing protein [Siminovitchia terrae]
MIFISHTFTDKDFVNEVALQLKRTYGKNNVFYDTWSIEFGESIIARMNEGLTSTQYFFLFITKESLESAHVEREWQAFLNSYLTNKKAREGLNFIPVLCDDVDVPIIFNDLVYINCYTNGLEVTIEEINRFIEGKPNLATENMYKEKFSNLYAEVISQKTNSDNCLELEIEVGIKRFIENNLTIEFLSNIKNPFYKVECLVSGMYEHGYFEGVAENKHLGLTYNSYLYKFNMPIDKYEKLRFKIYIDENKISGLGLDFKLYQTKGESKELIKFANGSKILKI